MNKIVKYETAAGSNKMTTVNFDQAMEYLRRRYEADAWALERSRAIIQEMDSVASENVGVAVVEVESQPISDQDVIKNEPKRRGRGRRKSAVLKKRGRSKRNVRQAKSNNGNGSDLIGERFGPVVVVGPHKQGAKRRSWIVECDCGLKPTLAEGRLTQKLKSCGPNCKLSPKQKRGKPAAAAANGNHFPSGLSKDEQNQVERILGKKLTDPFIDKRAKREAVAAVIADRAECRLKCHGGEEWLT